MPHLHMGRLCLVCVVRGWVCLKGMHMRDASADDDMLVCSYEHGLNAGANAETRDALTLLLTCTSSALLLVVIGCCARAAPAPCS